MLLLFNIGILLLSLILSSLASRVWSSYMAINPTIIIKLLLYSLGLIKYILEYKAKYLLFPSFIIDKSVICL